ncbi:MAG: peroxiredoxin-like family protein [Gammaproteobacteria bacterium]
MSLKEQLEMQVQNSANRIPEEKRNIFAKSMQNLKDSGITEKAIKEGDKAGSFTLPNAKGENISLDALLEQGPVVLSFYRGAWCPYCNLELKALQEKLPEIESLGAKLLAISPQVPDKSLSTAEKNELEFEVLSDVGNQVARQYGLVFEIDEDVRAVYDDFGIDMNDYNGDSSYTLPIPSTFVIDTDATVVKAHNDVDHRKRLEPDEIIETLQAI